MSATTVSPKYQVVIPKEIRERLRLRPGQKLTVYESDGKIELVPVPSYDEILGLVPNIKATGYRDKKDRY